MHRAASGLGFIVLATVALAGCERPPIDCSPFMYDEIRRTCVCPTGTVELDDGSCMLPDGGVIFPPGVDAGPRTDAGTDAGPDPIDGGTDSGVDGGTDACTLSTYYRDADGDSFGDPAVLTQACSMPAGFVDNDDDCNDACLACRPGGTEVCDEHDNDCDGGTDEEVLSLFFRDADGDTFGNPAMSTQACSMPAGFVDNDEDCNDACLACRPGGTEVCDLDMRDEDCEGGGNEGCACADGLTRPCPGGSDVGECVAGTQTCASGAWGACVGAVGPTGETCNAADDDCNTIPDDGSAALSCGSSSRASRVGCSGGACFVAECAMGWRDCDTAFANGCEAQLGTSSSCTACGDTCDWICGGSGCDDARTIGAGEQHTCALRESGVVMCWGRNMRGQLGDGSNTDRNLPVAVSGLSRIQSIAVGGEHACALLSGGTVSCWGSNTSGQLGNGSTTSSNVPVTVSSLAGVQSIAAGRGHSCALVAGGAVRCWGRNSSGQLGNNSTTASSTPVSVFGLSGATALSAGSDHTCALLSDRTVRCWGDNTYGQLGNGLTMDSGVPVSVSGLSTTVQAIAVGMNHSCALLSTGAAQCWGVNSFGQLGNGLSGDSSAPVTVSDLSGAQHIAAGALHTCAVVADRTVRCWGGNGSGRLGDGTTTTRRTPVPVLSLADASALALGTSHSCALRTAGGIACWGGNTYGQVGDGSNAEQHEPTAVLPP